MSNLPFNNQIRAASIGLIGMIPEAGGILKLFVSIMWPKEEPDYMSQVKVYVDQAIKDAINQEQLKDLREKIDGLRDQIYLAQDFKDSQPADYRLSLNALWHDAGILKGTFENVARSSPQTGLVYLVAFGTLYLSILRQRYESSFDNADARAKARQQIVAAINELIPIVQKARSDAIVARQTQLYIYDPGAHPPAYHLQDKLDSSVSKWYYDKRSAGAGLQNAKDDVLYNWNQYAYRLDELIDPFRYWTFFDPLTTNKTGGLQMATVTRTGDFTAGFDTLFSTRDAFLANRYLSGVNAWHDGNTVGLELLYGPNYTSAGKFGHCAGNPKFTRLNDAGADISACAGNFNSALRSFSVSQGGDHSHGAGWFDAGDGNKSWMYDFTNLGHKDSGYRLGYVTGLANSTGIGQLSLFWVRAVDWNGEFNEDHRI